MTSTVAVIGGGYGGIAAAKALDDVADVVLIEPRDVFVHNVAALRAVVDPDWADRLFLPYDQLLTRGRVIRDRAVRVDATSIELRSGETISADYIVLATGSGYPYPAKFETEDSSTAKAQLHATRKTLTDADSVLLLGAGPVGLELAGEIKAVWPNKAVTIVGQSPDILPGDLPDELRAELRRQLKTLGVKLVLGTRLREDPPSAPGEAQAFTVTTQSGADIAADIWFRCYGVTPHTDYLAAGLSQARQETGHLAVTPQLQLAGQERIFAIGDITALPEAKMAKFAGGHAAIVAANIRALITGKGELTTYELTPPSIVIPLGPTGGASYVTGMGLLNAKTTSQFKGGDLLVGRFADLLGLAQS
ncbi:MAG: FAD-dependent oxidoreductase [Mycobacteriales bacterium]